MNLKTIFVVFNLIIILFLVFIMVVPFFSLGLEYAILFWNQNWYLAGLAFLILASFDAYFLLHSRYFSLLEKENWSLILSFLEEQLAKKKVLSLQKTQVYIHSCLVLQNMAKLEALRMAYASKKPWFLPKVALSLGLPLFLEGRAKELEDFFSPLIKAKSLHPDQVWMKWALAVALLLKKELPRAKELLFSLISIKKDPVLQLLSLYLLDQLKTFDPEVTRVLIPSALTLKKRFTNKEWNAHIKRLTAVFVFFMGKSVQQALIWLKDIEPLTNE